VVMVMLGGLATSAILLIVVVAAIHFRYRRTLPGLEPGKFYDFAFWVSTISIALFAGYGAVSVAIGLLAGVAD
jgi:manganese transport protein